MSRSISFLLLCGLVFGTVWWLAPGFLERSLPYFVESRANELWPPAPVAEAEEKTEPRTPSEARSPQAAAAPQASVSPSEESTAIRNDDAFSFPSESSFEPRIFSISTEGTALYSANSPGGRVLRVLKKGDIVELQYTFINPGQEWTFVRVADQRVSGFLRSSSLGARNPTDHTTP